MKYLVIAWCCVFLSLQIGVLAQDVSSVISESQFNQILKKQIYTYCPDTHFYTYEAFVTATRSFKGFGTTGDTNTRKREVAAFLSQTSIITWGGAGGYCQVVEGGNHLPSYCEASQQWPCAPGKRYYGRGPIQIVGNRAYGPIGKAIGVNLLTNPDLIETDPIIAFKTAIWYWMAPGPRKPSSHNVITGRWVQSSSDKAANRMPGFGLVTNIFSGYGECGKGWNGRMQKRIELFKSYYEILGVNPGNNLDCGKQRPF